MPVVGRYYYTDENGKILYWKERIEPGRNGAKKEFMFYHGNTKGRGGDPVLYHLARVIKSKAVIITEGEKQADLLTRWGLCATSLDSGAGSKLTDAMIGHLTNKRIAILQDNDEVGTKYALKLAKGLQGKYESLRIVLLPDLPDKGDIMDWNGDKSQLLGIIKNTPEWIPPPEPVKHERKKIVSTGTITAETIEQASRYPIENFIELLGNKACCIAHNEKTPSMVYYPDRNKLHCYGCGWSGSAIDAFMLIDGCTFPVAVKQLIGRL